MGYKGKEIYLWSDIEGGIWWKDLIAIGGGGHLVGGPHWVPTEMWDAIGSDSLTYVI